MICVDVVDGICTLSTGLVEYTVIPSRRWWNIQIFSQWPGSKSGSTLCLFLRLTWLSRTVVRETETPSDSFSNCLVTSELRHRDMVVLWCWCWCWRWRPHSHLSWCSVPFRFGSVRYVVSQAVKLGRSVRGSLQLIH